MSKSIKEIIPLVKEESTGLQVPGTYRTLADSVIFRNGTTLQDEWNSKIEESSVVTRYVVPIIDGINQFDWHVLSFGGTYAQAQVHVRPDVSSRITYRAKPAFNFLVKLPVVSIGTVQKKFSKIQASIQLTEGEQNTFFTEAVSHNTMAVINDDGFLEITVVSIDGSVLTGMSVTGDFMINLSGILETVQA